MGPMAAAQPNATTSICYKCNKPCDDDTLRCHIVSGCNPIQKKKEVVTTATAAVMREAALKSMHEDFYGESVAEHVSTHEAALQKFLRSKGVAIATPSLPEDQQAFPPTPWEPINPYVDPYNLTPAPALGSLVEMYGGGGGGGGGGIPNGTDGGGYSGPVQISGLGSVVNSGPTKSPLCEVLVNDQQYYNLSEAGVTIMNKSGKRLKFTITEE